MKFSNLHQMPPVNSALYQRYHKAVRAKHGDKPWTGRRPRRGGGAR